MAKKNYDGLAEALIHLVGGKENVSLFTHCVTRLRFTVKDNSLVDAEAVNGTKGVIGSQWLGEQFQVIVGTEVNAIYDAVCKAGGFQSMAAIHENLDADLREKKKFTPKNIGNRILAYISPTMTGVIPIMMGACMCKTIAALLGPDVLNVISSTGDLYILLDFMYDAFFYFIPLFLGYSAAAALNISPMYGIYLGALIMAPDFMAMIGVRESFSVFGISAPVANYSASFLPVIVGVWIMSYLLRALNRVIPAVLKAVFVPLLTLVIMAPVMFVVCAPLGTYIGNVVGNFFIAMSQSNVAIRIFGAVLLSVLMPYMVLGGMHGALVTFAIMSFNQNGFENFLLPIMLAYNFAVFGVAFGAMLKLKKPENKTAVLGYFISGILGSITEPCLYGVIIKYRQTMKALAVASVAFGLVVGIFTPVYYAMTSATIFTFWVPWVIGGTANMVAGIAMMLTALFVGAVAACFVSYDEN